MTTTMSGALSVTLPSTMPPTLALSVTLPATASMTMTIPLALILTMPPTTARSLSVTPTVTTASFCHPRQWVWKIDDRHDAAPRDTYSARDRFNLRKLAGC